MSMFAFATRPRRLAAALALGVMASFAPVQAAELVMFERSGCPWCARWDAEVAPAYMKTPEGHRAPLRRHNLDQGQPRDIALERPVRYTPTFVLVDDGKEVGRITGYIDNGMFWGMLSPLMQRLTSSTGSAASGAIVSREQ
jgi:thioredoxin-related protein